MTAELDLLAEALSPRWLSLRFEVPKAWWMTSNQRGHWTKNKPKIANLRHLARLQAKHLPKGNAGLYANAQISVLTHGDFDPPNAWPTVKPLIDGMVDAGVLTGDSSKEVPKTSFTRGPRSTNGKYQVVLTSYPAGGGLAARDELHAAISYAWSEHRRQGVPPTVELVTDAVMDLLRGRA